MRQAHFTKPLTISLSEEQYTRIKDISDMQKISMSDWIRQALDYAFTARHMNGGNGHGKV
jgi:hypothetical protein